MDIVESAKKKATEVKNWVCENSEEAGAVVAILSLAFAGGVGIYTASRIMNDSQTVNAGIYDNKNGWNIEVERVLTNEELAQILKICRKKHCSITEVLADMDLLTRVYAIEK